MLGPGYYWWRIRCHVAYFPERVAWWLTERMPPKIALYCFIRVYGILGECGPEFDYICKAWEAKHKVTIR